MLMLIAGVHPDYRLNRAFSPDDMVKDPPRPKTFAACVWRWG
ncbi:hypothetical protein [Klebsiella pneumoniae]|nr:hypothetical protein [Klebsiella pneumoniae]